MIAWALIIWIVPQLLLVVGMTLASLAFPDLFQGRPRAGPPGPDDHPRGHTRTGR